MQAVVAAYQSAGFGVSVDHESSHYVRLVVSDLSQHQSSKVELVADIRLRTPVQMSVGPVLHADDVAGGKVDALLRSGRYTEECLLNLAAQRDDGFDRQVFAQMLAGIGRFPDAEFARYGVDAAAANGVRQRMSRWREELTARS